MMNCKQGDLAMLRRARLPENLGKIVRCVTLIPTMELDYPNGSRVVHSVWVIEPKLLSWDGTMSSFVPDLLLRPIRDPGDDARDETLEWLPVPKQTITGDLVIINMPITGTSKEKT